MRPNGDEYFYGNPHASLQVVATAVRVTTRRHG